MHYAWNTEHNHPAQCDRQWVCKGAAYSDPNNDLLWLWMLLTACLMPLAWRKIPSLQVIGWENGRPAFAYSKNSIAQKKLGRCFARDGI
jgi:hypothetical protein